MTFGKKIKKSAALIVRNIYLLRIVGFFSTVKLIYFNILLLYIDEPSQRWMINERKHDIIRLFIDKNYKGLLVDETPHNGSTIFHECIWLFWWQGLENMPPIVRKAYESILANSNGHKVILLDKSNLKYYIEIPEEIEKKVHNKSMCMANFSDYVRFFLLYNYGGAWLDCTILLTSPLSAEIFDCEFFTIKNSPRDNNCVGYYKYMVYFLVSKPGTTLFYNLLNVFSLYWETHSKALDYFFVDYCFDFAYRNNSYAKWLIDKVSVTNENILALQSLFNDKFELETYKRIIEDTQIHKLSYRGIKLSIDNNKKMTFYDYIVNS
jgi:hypothetical protein